MRPARSGSRRVHPAYRAGARAVAPLAAAVVGFGLSFGALAKAAGLSVAQVAVMSATTFAGSAQFAAVSVLGAAGSATAAIAAGVLLNGRYFPIGLSVAPAIHGPIWRRFLESQLIVDESWAVATGKEGRLDARRLVGAGLLLYPVWVASSTLGVVAARLVGDPERLGLDAAFPAVFLALLVPQIKSRRALLAALLGAGIALALVPLTPAGVPIVAAAAAILIGLRRSP